MARQRSFDRLASGIVASVLATSATACDGLGSDAFEEFAAEKDDVPCGPDGFEALADVELTQELDSIELVAFGGTGRDDAPPAEPGAREDVHVIARRGERCAGAEDAPACEAAAMAVLLTPDDVPIGESGPLFLGDQLGPYWEMHLLLGTVGDEVVTFRSREEVEALLGEVETPTEALWHAWLRQYDLCHARAPAGTRPRGDGWEVGATIRDSCQTKVTQALMSVSRDAKIEILEQKVISQSDGCAGRRPSCWRAMRTSGTTALGARLAGLAQLEAESVPAFAELARELSAHGAPRSLVRRAHRARRDEVRHARVMSRLARRHGGRPARSTVAQVAPRPLVEVAIANAREGCVREAFGALVGRWQAHRAQDPRLRAAMQRIARDEATHAGLSLAIDAWARGRLTAAERARVVHARAAALATLRDEVARANEAAEPSVAASLGLPSPAEATLLLAALARALA